MNDEPRTLRWKKFDEKEWEIGFDLWWYEDDDENDEHESIDNNDDVECNEYKIRSLVGGILWQIKSKQLGLGFSS